MVAVPTCSVGSYGGMKLGHALEDSALIVTPKQCGNQG
ncbi:hypothetical protein ACVILK_005282 [Bradyrhizobium embrapense]